MCRTSSGSNTFALDDINAKLSQKIEVRQNKYLNNLVEQDHRFIKRIIRPMLGFKAYASAEATLTGIELCHMLGKGQYENSNEVPAYTYFYSLAA